MSKLLIIEPLDIKFISEIKSVQPLLSIDYLPNSSIEHAKDIINKYHGLIVGSQNIDKKFIECWTNDNSFEKKMIVRAGSSLSNIDIETAKIYNISVQNTPGFNSKTVSEFIIKRIFDLNFNEFNLKLDQDMLQSSFHDRSYYYYNSLHDKVISIIGTGHIGSEVSKKCTSLGMKVKAYSPNLTRNRASQINSIFCESLEEALFATDFVTIQVPFITQGAFPTQGLLDKNFINLLNKNAKIINISVLKTMVIQDVVDAIKNHKISGFAFDSSKQDIIDLLKISPDIKTKTNVMLSPSCATASIELQSNLTREVIKIISEYWSIKN